jgi:hypothetical protein
MSTVVDSLDQGSLGTDLVTITAHAQVRFLERYVDARVVQRARAVVASDRAILDVLSRDYSSQLAEYRQGVGEAVFRIKSCAGTLPFESFCVKAGSVRVEIVGNTCVTTLPPRASGRPVRNRRSDPASTTRRITSTHEGSPSREPSTGLVA